VRAPEKPLHPERVSDEDGGGGKARRGLVPEQVPNGYTYRKRRALQMWGGGEGDGKVKAMGKKRGGKQRIDWRKNTHYQ